MYKRATICVFAVVCLLMLSLPAQAQRHRKANLNEDVPLPVDFTIDYQLGLTERGRIRGASPLLENTAYNEVGTEVFTKFVQTRRLPPSACRIVGTSRSLTMAQ